MSETELQVVCKSCGAEVSPYVTECPYCGARLRKRAPNLEERDGGLAPRRSRREKLRERRRGLPRPSLRPGAWATGILLVGSAVLLVVRLALGEDTVGFGAVGAPSPAEWWRFLLAPLVYEGVGYLFGAGLAIAFFGAAVEQRLGTPATAVLLIACGSLGILGAFALADQRGAVEVLAGGNGTALGVIAAWWIIRRTEARRSGESDSVDWVPALIAAVVILALSLVQGTAEPFAAIIGGATGALAAVISSIGSRRAPG